MDTTEFCDDDDDFSPMVNTSGPSRSRRWATQSCVVIGMMMMIIMIMMMMMMVQVVISGQLSVFLDQAGAGGKRHKVVS